MLIVVIFVDLKH